MEQGLKSVTTVEFKWMKDETLSEDFVKVKEGTQAFPCFAITIPQHIIRIFLFSVCCSRLSLKRYFDVEKGQIFPTKKFFLKFSGPQPVRLTESGHAAP